MLAGAQHSNTNLSYALLLLLAVCSVSKSIRAKLESGKRQAYLSRFLCLLSDQRVLQTGKHQGVISSIQALKLQVWRLS